MPALFFCVIFLSLFRRFYSPILIYNIIAMKQLLKTAYAELKKLESVKSPTWETFERIAILSACIKYFEGDICSNANTLTAEKEACDKLCVCCYHHLLEDVLLYPVFYCDGSETVRDIAESTPHKKSL